MKYVPRVFLPAAAIVAACTPDTAGEQAAADVVIVNFDPSATVPVVPSPNDLAKDATTGKIVVPQNASDTPAQAEFNKDYLGTLTGFPFESTASATTSAALNPATVNSQTVAVIDLTSAKANGGTADAFNKARVDVTPTFADNKISIAPPTGGWTRGKTYAVVLIAGANGLKGATGVPVLGSATWGLVSAKTPLVTCADLKTDCKPTVDIIPSDVEDPAGHLADQTKKALQLEQLRLGYKPILDAFETAGVARSAIPLAWTFSIVDAGEVTFDPADSVIPFPNDAVRTGTASTLSGQNLVKLPNPKTGAELDAAACAAAAAAGDTAVSLYCGLNTLDGFSTLAPLVSENSDTAAAVAQAKIDAASLSASSVGLARLATTLPAGAATALQTTPSYTPCLNCMSSTAADGTAQTTQQLQWKLNAPLDERTTYAGYVTTDVKDDAGKNVVANPVFALVRSAASLLTSDGHAAVNILTDEQAKALEPLRLAYKPMFDALDAAGVKRSSLALAWPFTTQSEGSVLDQLRGYPSSVPQIPDTAFAVADKTSLYKAVISAGGGSTAALGKIYTGTFATPLAVTGTSGTLDVTHPQPQAVNFVLFMPASGAATGVTIFGHGFTRSRNDAAAIANTIASTGQAVIAIDTVFHGTRTSCTGSKLVNGSSPATDDASCNAASKCDEGTPVGLCVLKSGTRTACAHGDTGDLTCLAAGEGRCASDNLCQGAGADFLPADATNPLSAPSQSGWNIFSLTNFFATRDNFRQQVIDLAKLVNVLKATGAGSLASQIGTDTIATNNINYVGQSLGGILGTLFNAVSPDTNNVVLNVPGGQLPGIILTAPSFAAQRTALLSGLAAQGFKQGTPGFDQFINTVQWILDPADPANLAYRLTHSADMGSGAAPNANRKAFIQFIEGDQTVPNSANLALVAAANRSFSATAPSFGCVAPLSCFEFTAAGSSGTAFDDTTAAPSTRHGFLLSPPKTSAGAVGAVGGALTVTAQTQAATFLATGALPASH